MAVDDPPVLKSVQKLAYMQLPLALLVDPHRKPYPSVKALQLTAVAVYTPQAE